MILIRRYANRKLYDTKHSRYVTLKDLRSMVQKGEDVQIIDNETGEDITQQTLANILIQIEKQKKDSVPHEVLIELVRTGGESVMGYFKKSINAGVNVFGQLESEIKSFTSKLLDMGIVSKEEKETLEKRIPTWIENRQKEVEKFIEASFSKAYKSVKPATSRDMETLRKKIELLQKKMEKLESVLEKRNGQKIDEKG